MSSPHDLDGRVVALSTSPPNDAGRLGFPASEYDRVVFNLCARVMRARGRILYGGHLREGSLTAQMYEYVAKAYAPPPTSDGPDPPKPFVHLLPLSEFRKVNFARLRDAQTNFGSFVETRIVLAADRYVSLGRRSGALLAREGAGGDRETMISGQKQLLAFGKKLSQLTEAEALTAMREASLVLTAARIVIGGKRGDLGVAGDADRYSGKMPGIYEEALNSIGEGKPTFVLGAYGGAARDVAIDLGLIDAAKGVPFLGAAQESYADARARMRDVRAKLAPDNLQAMSDFACREDSEALARDVVDWIVGK
jgi:hypothetical protein